MVTVVRINNYSKQMLVCYHVWSLIKQRSKLKLVSYFDPTPKLQNRLQPHGLSRIIISAHWKRRCQMFSPYDTIRSGMCCAQTSGHGEHSRESSPKLFVAPTICCALTNLFQDIIKSKILFH